MAGEPEPAALLAEAAACATDARWEIKWAAGASGFGVAPLLRRGFPRHEHD
jgi:hypothetical protein